MKQLPTRLHRLLAAPFLLGLALISASHIFEVGSLLPAGLAVFGGSAFCFAIADVRHMLATRRGFGRLSSHVTEAANPVSFKLHVSLLLILACLWGVIFVAGLLK